jgi:hypothetical protein
MVDARAGVGMGRFRSRVSFVVSGVSKTATLCGEPR